MNGGRTVGMRRSEDKQGWVLLVLGTERDIPNQQRRRMRGKQGKDEIIVEMSEMCLRASFADLPTDIVVRGEENGYSCRSLSPRDRRFCSHANYPQQCAARSA